MDNHLATPYSPTHLPHFYRRLWCKKVWCAGSGMWRIHCEHPRYVTNGVHLQISRRSTRRLQQRTIEKEAVEPESLRRTCQSRCGYPKNAPVFKATQRANNRFFFFKAKIAPVTAFSAFLRRESDCLVYRSSENQENVFFFLSLCCSVCVRVRVTYTKGHRLWAKFMHSSSSRKRRI